MSLKVHVPDLVPQSRLGVLIVSVRLLRTSIFFAQAIFPNINDSVKNR